jgi:hypothetical protein
MTGVSVNGGCSHKKASSALDETTKNRKKHQVMQMIDGVT